MLKKLFFYASGTIFVKLGILCIIGIASGVHAQTWVEDTFDDFSDGTLDASGQNIYVSRSGTKLTIAVRSAATEESLTEKPWHTVESGVFRLNTNDCCLQYRATFVSDNGDRYPVLDRVNVTLNR